MDLRTCTAEKLAGLLPKWKAWIWYTVLFFIIGTVIFFPFVLYQKTLLWESDGFLQWYSILAKLKSVVTDFFCGKGFSFWSWDTGLGSDLIGNYAQVLFDPFCYIAVLFPYAKLDIAYSVIVVIKLYFAGLSMLGFLRYHRKSLLISVLSAAGYAFSAWSLVALRHVFFLTALIFFPLIVLGVDRVDDKKSPTLLITSVMMSVLSSLYFSYMTAIAIAAYVMIKYFLEQKEKSVSGFLLRLGKYILYAVVGGVVLAAPVMLTSLYTLRNASTGTGVNIRILPSLKALLRFIPSFAAGYDMNSNYSVLGLNMLAVIMIPAMVLLVKKKITSIVMFFIFSFCALLPLAESIMNGFSYASGRWCYVLCFFYIYAAADAMEDPVVFTPKYKKGAVAWICIIVTCTLTANIFWNAISALDTLVIVINICFGVGLLYFVFQDEKRIAYRKLGIAAVTVLSIIVIPICSNSPNMLNGMSIFMSPGKTYEIYSKTSFKKAAEWKGDDFYRFDTVDYPDDKGNTMKAAHTVLNTSIFYQVPTVAEYLSTVDKYWLEYNHLLLNSAGEFRRVCTYSNDNRTRMDFLFGVKYFFGKDKGQTRYAGYGFKKIAADDDFRILESQYNAGLGYVYNKVMPKSEFIKYDPEEREQLLMQCVEMEDDEIDLDHLPVTELTEPELENQKVDAVLCTADGTAVEGGSFTVFKKWTDLQIKTDQEIRNSELYVVFNGLKKKPVSVKTMWEWKNRDEKEANPEFKEDIFEKKKYFSSYLSYTPYENFSVYLTADGKDRKKRMVNFAGDKQGIRDRQDYIINLGYFKSFHGNIDCQFEDIGEYTYDSIEVIAMPIKSYKKYAKNLSGKRLKIKENCGDDLKGVVKSDQGGILYLSILYNKGWKIYIDGKKADKVYRVNTAFTGVAISPGKHTVQLHYRPLGYPYAFFSFAAGVLMTVAFELYFRKKKQENK